MSDDSINIAARPASHGGSVYEGVTYAFVPGYRPLVLDLHVPPGSGPVPVVIWVHGGGFLSGDRRYLPKNMTPGSLFAALVRAGLAVATIDYRLSVEARFPAQLDDIAAALEFLRTHADHLGLDPGRIGISGDSAGGCLAALSALKGQGFAAAAAWYPVTDLRSWNPDPNSPEGMLFDAPPRQRRKLAESASPVCQVSSAAPPFFLIHGTADTVVPASHSERLNSLLIEAGVQSTYLPVPGADHCFEGHKNIGALIDKTVEFFARQL